MSKKILVSILLGVLATPSIILAQQLYRPGSPVDTFSLSSNLEMAIWIIFTLIVVICFIMAGVMFLTSQGQPDKIATAKSALIWGIVGVIVGIIAYSIIAIISNLIL